MRLKTLIISFVILILTICVFFNVKVNNYRKYIEELNQKYELLSSKYESSLKFIGIYQKIKTVCIIDTSSLISPLGYRIKTKKVIGNKEHIIMWISYRSCNTCYIRELETLKEVISQQDEKDRIIFLVSGLDNNRSFEYFLKEQNIQNYAYRVRPDFLSKNIIVDSDIPFISLIDSSLILKNIILLDKSIPASISANSINALLHDLK